MLDIFVCLCIPITVTIIVETKEWLRMWNQPQFRIRVKGWREILYKYKEKIYK
jgi:hypothetical protein